jgi:hypothetical protein
LVYRAYDEPVHGEGIRFPIVRIMGRDTMPPDEVVRMFAWERSMDGELVAQGLESTSQFELVLLLKGDEWAGRADLVDLDAFIRSVERPGTSTAPGGPPRSDQ